MLSLALVPAAVAGALPGGELFQPGSMAQPVAVFGADDRVPLPPRLAKYQDALGVLFNARARTVCTAFCIAENVIATASHCLFRTSGEAPQKLSDFWFARNYDAVKDYARISGYNIGAASQNVLSGSRRLSVQPPIDATSDWALVRLSRPICTKGVFDIKPLSTDAIIREAKGKHVFQLSYHRDFPQWRIAYSKPCDTGRDYPAANWATIAPDFSRPEDLILHTCDTGGASSGSPLLIETPDGPKVIGINVGTYVQSKVLLRDGQANGRVQTETIANTGVAATAFADHVEPFKRAIVLLTAPLLKELQERLKQRHFYAGELDGTYGPTLQTAIEEFEKANRMPALGLATDQLLRQLRDLSGGQQLPAAAHGVRVP